MRVPVAVALVLATAGIPAAQTTGDAQPTFRTGVDAVTVAVSVRDRRGRVVRGLSAADFEVRDSGTPVTVTDFYAGASAVSLALLLDISGSMAVGGNMDQAREAVAVTTMNLRHGIDEAALFTFDSTLREVVGFSRDLSDFHRLNLDGRPWGLTSLFDAIAGAAEVAASRASHHRAVFVITDGIDTGSRLTAPEVSGIASAIDVPVYVLTVATPIDHPGGRFEARTAEQAARSATLADLARWTGGDSRVASTPAHTLAAVRDLFEELQHQYLISFEPGSRPGWHPLDIRTLKGDLVVRSRGGYVAGPSGGGS